MEPRRHTHPKASGIVIAVLLAFVFIFALHRVLFRPSSTSRETRTTGAEVERDPDAPAPTGANRLCQSHMSCADSELCTRGRCDPISPRTPECRTTMIRFARTTAELSTVAEMAIERTARCIKAGGRPTIAIEASRDPFAGSGANGERTEARRRNVSDALAKRGVPREYLDEIQVRR